MNRKPTQAPPTDRIAFGYLVLLLALAVGGCHQSSSLAPPDGDGGSLRDGSTEPDAMRPPDASVITPDWAFCEMSEECIIRPESCCGQCGVATPDDMIGVNASFRSVYRDEVACAGDSIGCPECAAPRDPNLYAVCESNRCEARDLRRADLGQGCSEDSDCILVSPTCCGGCGELGREQLISILSDNSAALRDELDCSPDIDCPPCVGEPVTNLRAICSYANVCIVTDDGGAPPSRG